MKKFIFIYTSFVFTLSVHSQNINTPENFPDQNFRKFIEWRLEVPTDAPFSAEDVKSITQIKFLRINVESVKGLEFFEGLTFLQCSENNIAELDLSKFPLLESLDCDHNQLTSLDISKNPNLTFLDCTNNQIKEMEITNHKHLKSFFLLQ